MNKHLRAGEDALMAEGTIANLRTESYNKMYAYKKATAFDQTYLALLEWLGFALF